MIQDQSESNSERGKDKNLYLSEEAGLTPLLAMTQSFEDCDWLVVQEGSKSAFKSRVYSEPYRDRVATTEVQNAWSSRDSRRLQIVPGSALAGNSNCKNRVTELRFLVISRQ